MEAGWIAPVGKGIVTWKSGEWSISKYNYILDILVETSIFQ